ncbi:tail length tape measure protein [Pseudomonas phage PspYZU01]|uniref:Lysozyme n=1 Tax=Pseudomonas phage PspYZU01 TaxID=1983555 RepID=A0A2U7NEW8_9CAUD|nr:tail length tape measure protein [Pseudomonas phage PspYZU01]ASD51921.1 tape measure protein [Pseudomonas phage PspYZU01]
MAKQSRDVQLVVKAKNEASKALNSITSALRDLTQAQSQAGTEAGKTGSRLQRLGGELGKLKQTLGGVTAFDKLASSVDKAGQAVGRLETGISELTQEQQKLNQESSSVQQSMSKMSAASARLATELERGKTAVAEARTENAGYTRELKNAESSLKKREQAEGRLSAAVMKGEQALVKAQQRHRDLTTELLNADKPSERLVASFTKADIALANQVKNLTKARETYASNRAQIGQLAGEVERLRSAQAQSASTFEKARESQAQTAQEARNTSAAMKELTARQRELQQSSANNAQALERQQNALAQSRQELQALQMVAQQAGVSMEKLGSNIRQSLLRTLSESQQALVNYRLEWQQTTAAIAQMQAGRGRGQPMTPELQALIDKARASKQAMQDLQLGVQQMRASLREAGNDVTKLTAAEAQFIAVLNRVKTAEDSVSQATQRHAQSVAASAAANDKAASSLDRLGNGYNRVASAGSAATRAMDEQERRGRAAMTWTQRLHGEVVALGLSYIGLYAAITQLQGVVDTYMTIEAAQSRMMVAFGGNAAIVGREMRFIREQADRLGIEVGALANEYSKFAVATQGSALAGEQTRKIFTAVSEAARVNKLSIDQIKGTYLALTQMVSKGNVSMEELRQQLGERLYGAFTIAAKAMGLTGKELDKLVSSGQLATDEFLPKFAEELNKTFGPQLEQSLKTLTTQVGVFQNEIFKTQERVGNAGFIDGLREGIESLTNFLKSEQGIRLFEGLGAAAGVLVKVLAQIPEHLGIITFGLSLLAGTKALAMVKGMGSAFQNFTARLKAAAPAITATNTATNAFAGVGGTYIATTTRASAASLTFTQRLTTMTTAMRTATAGMNAQQIAAVALSRTLGVLRGVMAAMGGLPGLLITGASIAFSMWASSADGATDALQTHETQLGKVIDAYSVAKDKAGDWAKEVKGVTLAGLTKTAQELGVALGKSTDELNGMAGAIKMSRQYQGSDWFGNGAEQLIQLNDQLQAGQITVHDFSAALNDMLRDDSVSQRVKDLITRNADLLEQSVKTERAVAENAVAIEAMGGKAAAANPLVEKLGLSIGKMAKDAGLIVEQKANDPLAELAKQIDAVSKKVPSLHSELKAMEDLKALDKILGTANAIEGLDATSESYKKFLALVARAQKEIKEGVDEKQFKDVQALLTAAGSGQDLSAKLIKSFEGFKTTAYWDVNAYRAGFGSDTTTLADGTVQKITQGMKVSLEDSNRDLLRRIDAFQATVQKQIGPERFQGMNPQQQAALTSIAYNYGSLPERITKAIKEGSNDDIAQAIKDLGTDNAGVNRERRESEAYVFRQGDDFNPKGMEKVYEKQLETAKKFHEELKAQTAIKQEQGEADKRQTLEQMQRIAILKAENGARKAGTELTQAEREAINASVTALHAKKQAEWDAADAKKAQVEGEQKINTLMALRRDILAQMDFANKIGDVQAYEQLRGQLEQVTTRTQEAIQAMIQFWEASGNSDKAQAAIASLKTMQNSMVKVDSQAILTGATIGKALGQQAKSGMDSFLDRIKETGNVLESAKSAFQNFAVEFLMQIAKMILQAAILGALMAAFGFAGVSTAAGSIGGGIISGLGGSAGAGGKQAHTGGRVGAGLKNRSVNPGWFTTAAKFHTGGVPGGVPGLKSNEVPTILEEGEVVRTEEQEKALARRQDELKAAARQGQQQPKVDLKVVNAVDSNSILSEAMSTAPGQQVMMNFLRANKGKVQGILS